MTASLAPTAPVRDSAFRTSEILSALSCALDITEGQPPGHAVRTCLIGMRIAERVGRSTAQVTLRWHIQRGDIVFPKSVTPERVQENFELFDFELTDADMADITELNRNERTGPDPDTFNHIPR